MNEPYTARVLPHSLDQPEASADPHALLQELLQHFQALRASEARASGTPYAASLPICAVANKSIFPDFAAQQRPPLHSSVRQSAQPRTSVRPPDPQLQAVCSALATHFASAANAAPRLVAASDVPDSDLPTLRALLSHFAPPR